MVTNKKILGMKKMYKKILVSIADDEHSLHALEQALIFADKSAAEIIGVFVGSENTPEQNAAFKEKVEKAFPDFNFLAITSKNIASAIAETAENENCDLIVMGSRRLPGPTSLVMRSVTNAVISASQKPVLVI